MRDVFGKLAALAAGAAAMYYLDPETGRSRRALLRDKLVGASHDAARLARREARHAADQVRGMVATGHLDRVSRSEPHSDAQLRERVRSRLGRLVSHPRAVEVEVNNGVVRLSGDVLSKESDGLLSQVREMAAVRQVVNAMTTHEHPDEITKLHGQRQPGAAEEEMESGRS